VSSALAAIDSSESEDVFGCPLCLKVFLWWVSRMRILPFAFAVVVLPQILRADVSLPAMFSEHMVLQRSASTPVWGQAAPGEKITVAVTDASGAQAEAATSADTAGHWRVNLDLSDPKRLPAGTAYQVVIKGNNTITIPDTLVGEVWLASGQSNMALAMKQTRQEEEIANSANNEIRFFTVGSVASLTPKGEVGGKWVVASPETTPRFSAVAYYFARLVQKETSTPVGIIQASWGGTPVEAWTSIETLRTDETAGKIADAEVTESETFPEVKAAWLAKLKPWLAANQREDEAPSAAEVEAFAKAPASAGTAGWSTVKLPGSLPGDCTQWVRRDISVPESAVGKPFVLDFDEIVGLDTVYFDGKQVGGRTWETFDGFGRPRLNSRRLYTVPAADVTAGPHTVAVRIFAPLGESGINGGYFSAGGQSLTGEWLIKTEKAFPALSPEALAAKPEALKAPQRPWNVASSLYNGMIHGLVPYGLRGVIWYQGENNSGNAAGYRATFPLLIKDWRKQWGKDDMSFYWCQLPNFGNISEDPNASPGWAGIREAQALTLKLPRTGQAVTIDAGEAGDIHPIDKHAPGERLAALALAHDYGKAVEFSGPVYDSMKVEGNAIRIQFQHVGKGLVARPVPEEYLFTSTPQKVMKPLKRNSPSSELEGFLIRGGGDKKWVWADARIDGDSVVVSSPKVAKPEAVRYAWFSNPTINLYNTAGFPAAPFRTDTD